MDGDHFDTHHSTNKGDKEGKDKSTKACYANPYDPRVCLFTGLGIYLLCNAELDGNYIFVRTRTVYCIEKILFSCMTGLFAIISYYIIIIIYIYIYIYIRT